MVKNTWLINGYLMVSCYWSLIVSRLLQPMMHSSHLSNLIRGLLHKIMGENTEQLSVYELVDIHRIGLLNCWCPAAFWIYHWEQKRVQWNSHLWKEAVGWCLVYRVGSYPAVQDGSSLEFYNNNGRVFLLFTTFQRIWLGERFWVEVVSPSLTIINR